MTTKLSLFAISASLLFLGCAKNQAKNVSTSDLVRQAQQYFTQSIAGAGQTPVAGNYRAGQPRTVLWDSATVQHFSDGDAVVIPISYRNNLYVSSPAAPGRIYRLKDLTSLVISRDSTGRFSSAVVTFMPDSTNSPRTPHGAWFVEDWQGNSIYGPVHSSPPGNPKNVAITSKEVDYTQSIQVCDEIYGYNYSPDDPEGGVAWMETTCTTYGLQAQNPGAGLPASRLASLPTSRYLPSLELIVPPPNNVIGNIQDYLKCFSNYGGTDHTYQVTICIDQPDPGTREAWGFNSTGVSGSSSGANPVDVGHTWLVLSENFSGYSIVRNVGFYPQTAVYPWSPSAQGALNNDDGHGYNVSLTITVDNGQFFNILNYISQGNNAGYMYNLNTNNCTSFALHAVGAGDINIPATVGSWPDGGNGYDPGDLGQDIQNMQLAPNMTRSTSYSDHPNKYSCN